MKRVLAPAIAGLLLLAGCSVGPTSEVKGDNSDTGISASAESSKGVTATFKVTTSGKTHISWGTASGSSSKDIKAGSWSKEVKLDDGFDVATLTAMNGDFMKSVKISCEILINGVSKSKNSAAGKSAVASCNANTTD